MLTLKLHEMGLFDGCFGLSADQSSHLADKFPFRRLPLQCPPTCLHKCKHVLYGDMNNKHRKTLGIVFNDPVSGTIEWSAIEKLLIAAGVNIIEGNGSRVCFVKGNDVETFHRPHPAKEAKRYQVRAARAFLERIGVTP